MKKTARVIYFVIILSLILSFFMGCQVSPNIAYDNFITDLDIIYRFEDIAFNIEFGRYSSVFQSDIKYLIKDIKTLNIEDIKANSINSLFLLSANSFLRASINLNNGNDVHAQVIHEFAKSKYVEALTEYNNYIIK